MVTYGGSRAATRLDAECAELVRVLRGYGVLTRDRLRELSGARHWCGPRFESALEHAVESGRIRRLSDELYEIDEAHPA